MDHSDQGITRTERGEEQPKDKARAQKANRTDAGEASPSREETRKKARETLSRSGHE